MQAATVLVPRRRPQGGRHGWVGIVAPAAALGAGVLILRVVGGGPHALALAGAIATPLLAAAGAPNRSLAAGLVVLCAIDVVLVWATPQVGPATTALHGAPLPTAAGHPIPRLGDATFGSATMGWLDFAAAALLGVIVTRRLRAAVATGLAAGAWGLLLVVTATVPATVPTLVGLLVGKLR